MAAVAPGGECFVLQITKLKSDQTTCTCRRPGSRAAAAAVARAGEQVLPRAKGQRLAREHRAKQVALQRAEPRPGR